MMERVEPGEGFTVLDGVALVMGAAVASVHLRGVIRDDLNAFGWALAWFTFTWIALTATGPFLFVVRRFARRLSGYPKVGDGLWALLGSPWLLTTLLRSSSSGERGGHDELFAAALSVGIAVASLVALGVIWTTWVTVPPEQAARTASAPWTNRVGLILAVAWPIQCGLGLVLLS